MIYQDYYKILEVSQDASIEEIKKSYRKLAMKYHPDRNDGDKRYEEKFKQIVEAYDVLSDPEKRRKYDSFGGQQHQQHKQKSQPNYTQTENNTNFSYRDYYGYSKKNAENDLDKELEELKRKWQGFSEFFKEFFGKSGKKENFDVKNGDVQGKITIELEEAFTGSSRIINILNKKLRLKVKPGIQNNQLLKIKGEGKPSPMGNGNGDIYIRIVVKPHPVYKRKGNDLYCEKQIDIYTAILGGKINLQTLKGEVRMSVPQGIENGKSFRIKGYGMPDYDYPENMGDLYLKIHYTIPKNLTEEEKNLLQKLSEIHKFKLR